MQTSLPLTRNLLLIGGGHTHALLLRKWGMHPLPGARVTLVNPGPTAPYTGMLPGFVAGHYERDELNIDLVKLARFADASFINDRAVAVDPENRLVTLAGGRKVAYDALSIDVGITSAMPDLPGFVDHAVPAKPLDQFANKWESFRKAVLTGEARPDIAVIGGGIGGVELALAMHHALKSDQISDIRITLIDRSNILTNISKTTSDLLQSRLRLAKINIVENQTVTSVGPDSVTLDGHYDIASSFTVGVAGGRPHLWLAGCGLDLTDGFITVGPQLHSLAHSNVFAVGDCAHMAENPRPKAGVFAVRQAPILYHNLRASLSGGKLHNFKPQRDYLKLISLGEKSAIATKWGRQISGAVMWHWKDFIDRKFMDQFIDLTPMETVDLPAVHATGLKDALGSKPMCGGCGAKVGGQVLQDVLCDLPTSKRDDVVSEPGDDAAILKQPGGGFQVMTTDHLRSFVQDPWLMARITAVHALGDIWAMGAEPQAVTLNLTVPRMSSELQGIFVSEVMQSISEIVNDTGAEIVGGHTSMGAEFSIGLTVTGLTKSPITLAGAQPGDAILLTKPIGSGTIMAGDMALAAKGDWVIDALTSMSKPQRTAARVLRGAHAMTDVTGFGLAGHAAGLARASNVTIELDLNAIPTLNGAEELAAQGVRSTLYDANRALLPDLDPSGSPRAELLFDPQTSGGLLAAIPQDSVSEIVIKLKTLNFDAHVIGTCLDPDGSGPVRLLNAAL
ncbi:MAG: selenide, water dikinase SelD [Marinosulfonomonas sp.]